MKGAGGRRRFTRGQLVGRVGGLVTVDRSTWPAASAGYRDRPGQHLRPDRVEPELERGDHAEVRAATAHPPEEIGMLGRAGGPKLAVGRHDVDGEEVVQVRPCLRISQPKPPPRVRPATPVWVRSRRWWPGRRRWVAWSSSPQVQPGLGPRGAAPVDPDAASSATGRRRGRRRRRPCRPRRGRRRGPPRQAVRAGERDRSRHRRPRRTGRSGPGAIDGAVPESAAPRHSRRLPVRAARPGSPRAPRDLPCSPHSSLDTGPQEAWPEGREASSARNEPHTSRSG